LWVINTLRESPTVIAYFGAANGAATALQTYTARGAGFSSTGSAKLHRRHWGKKSSSTGRSKLQRAALVQIIHTLVCIQHDQIPK
jgi:hypothetical protein